ncbi:uncharacterized protein J4E88_007298 [Alternaria novae-zelandiae]|uniref:uncharacterized protein n=1 Tax=Alternaria novae-zelandiae TaxID=430562 RepID=UPI0020C22AB5|nr:uncharacterized protein J4E88_007298 [Alternaria novae-zelandiae]KAI4676382.1 hypothetical protein J4E88_007298 [Alternaria novae-zelandiae]
MSSSEDIPAPPVKYAHAPPEGEELKQWKTLVLAMIDKRIDLYPRPCPNNRRTRAVRAVLLLFVRIRQLWRNALRIWRSKLASASWTVDVEQDQRPVSLDSDRVVTAIEKAGHVPELVENIIRFADEETQMHAAWNVSTLWRHTVAHVMTTPNSFRPLLPYEVVERGSTRNLDAMSSLPEPSDEDFQIFEQEMLLLREFQASRDADVATRDYAWSGIYRPYWPARIYASKALPDHLKTLYHLASIRNSLNSETDEWRDFTQFEMNTYFQTVFARQLTESVGVYEFKLEPLDRIENLVFGTTPYLGAFRGLVGPMQLTQPPCKAIELRVQVPFVHPDTQRDVGYPLFTSDSMNTIVHVLNSSGITCEQLCEALEECADMVLRHWRRCAKQFRENVLGLEHYTNGIWTLRGRPTIYIVLSDIRPRTLNVSSSALNVPSIIDRQLEWIPKELVRTTEHVEIRDGRLRRYPDDLES